MLNQEVRKIMTTHPTVATPNQSLKELTQLMIDAKVQQLPVVDQGQLVGMVTTHDLWKFQMNNGQPEETNVSQIMCKNIIKISPLDKVGTAAELFMDKRFKTLPVVNLRNEFKGVVTAFDVIKHTLKQEYKQPILYKEIIETE